MNILRCLLIISALASLLVTGPNLVSSPSVCRPAGGGDNDGDYKITKDYKDSIQKDVNAKSEKTNQHLGQDNLCYRDDGCEQANEGQQLEGKDNTASGFNDQRSILANTTTSALSPGTQGSNGDRDQGQQGPPGTPQPPQPPQPSFSNPVPLDNRLGDQTDPHIASSGSSVYAVWTNGSLVQGNILFAKSTDGGATFSTPIPLSDQTTSFSFLPDVAVDNNNNNNVYVVWARVTTVSEVVIVKSTDGGVNFGPPVVLNPGPLANGRNGEVAVSGNNVYVTWQDFSTSPDGSDSETFFASSTDGGATYSTPINISNNPGTLSKNPSIAAFGSNVHVAWSDCDNLMTNSNCKILYTKSSNGGLGFTSPVALTAPESSLPDIKVFGNNVYVVYGQAYPVNGVIERDVFLLKSTDGGQSFGSPVNLSASYHQVQFHKTHTLTWMLIMRL